MIRTTRFSESIWFKYLNSLSDIYITIGGLGSIGSHLMYVLPRSLSTNARFFCYEYDNLESTNLGGQFFTVKQAKARMPKFDATFELVKQFTDDFIIANSGKATEENCETTPFTFVGFDSLAPRKLLFENWVKNLSTFGQNSIFIDGRMSFDGYQIFVVLPDNEYIEKYRLTFFEETKETSDVPCTLKNNTFIATQLASKMVEFFTIAMQLYSGQFAMLPFKCEYANTIQTIEYYDIRVSDNYSS